MKVFIKVFYRMLQPSVVADGWSSAHVAQKNKMKIKNHCCFWLCVKGTRWGERVREKEKRSEGSRSERVRE